MPRERGRGRAVLVEADGGRVPFDFAEVERTVSDMIHPRKHPDDVAKEIVDYVIKVVVSIKLTTKYKPWKHEFSPGSPGEANGSAYRKGVYDGWELFQQVLREEVLK